MVTVAMVAMDGGAVQVVRMQSTARTVMHDAMKSCMTPCMTHHCARTVQAVRARVRARFKDRVTIPTPGGPQQVLRVTGARTNLLRRGIGLILARNSKSCAQACAQGVAPSCTKDDPEIYKHAIGADPSATEALGGVTVWR
jgi:hypothetical protein